jgi:hypothetical protein
MKKDTQNINEEPNDPLIGDPRMKGRRWQIDPYYDDHKTFSKIQKPIKKQKPMPNNKFKYINEFDKWTDTEHNDWDVSYREFYEDILEEQVGTLTGGVGDATATSDVDPVELSLGQTVEMEHTTDPNIATEIALDHLSEDPQYYTKLRKAGLAKELDQVNTTSGFGDPEHPINDKKRLGTNVTCTAGNNIIGTIGNTPNGSIDGRKNVAPIVDKTVEIDITEPTYQELNEVRKKKKKRGAKPTNPKLWSRAKSMARSKFDVYPSAYANAWAAKWYKKKGGGWR